VNGGSIVQELAWSEIEYFHVELDRHAILFAEGLTAESYLDTGNRAFFANAGLAMVTHPEFHINAGLRCWEEDACAPLAVSPDAVMPVWHRIADRAESLGHSRPEHATTDDADLHLVADGRRLYPVSVEGRKHVFMVPAGRTGVRLASRASVPGVLKPYVDDARRLGVAIRGLTIRSGSDVTAFAADHPALAQGWHAAERANGTIWRWTNGDALLPIASVHGALMLEIQISDTHTYLLHEEQAAQRLAA